ncbi:MAG: 50S ribosomal protein L25 [Chitinispirillales bacterium]|nr:50S ribosomal protein L25 [Chitinispirillales bacterium]
MEVLKLQARERTGTGKSYARKARVAGWIPAVYYGRGLESKKIEVSHKDFSAVVRARKHKHLFDLGLGGGSVAIIREVQRHSLKDSTYFNLDFMHVNMDEKMTVEVPLEFVGVPVGVKEDGGILGHPLKTVKVESLPAHIPERVTVDVSALRIGDSIRVSDVSIPEVEIKRAPEDVLAAVSSPAREVAATTDEAADGAAAPAGKKK